MDALIVFARPPRPGDVKTRLTPPLTETEAAELYTAFLSDALHQYAGLDVDVRLYGTPPPRDWPDTLATDGVSLHWQHGPSLGPRMQHAFLETFGAGYGRSVIIGTDHPTLPTAFVEMAFEILRTPLSICIGPSDDGGYYLLGMNEFYPALFADMTFSHEDVFAQTVERAGRTRAELTVLPAWYDVDTPETLERLYRDLSETRGAGAPETWRVLQRIWTRLVDFGGERDQEG